MQIEYHKDFKKQFKKLPSKIKLKFSERLELFLQNPFHALLNIYPLKGEWVSQKSINITRDYRAIYLENVNKIIFLEIGTHSQLYE